MIITIQDDERRVEIETPAEGFEEVMEDVKGLFIAWGFHPDTVKDYFSVENNDIE